MKLSDYLSESGIELDFQGNGKREIIRNLVGLLSNTVALKDVEKIIETLEEREKLKTTGIGSGIAIPHCKSVEVDKVQLVIGISKKGIDFQSLDGKPANLFFLLVAPEKGGSEHLKVSAKIVRLFRESSVQEKLLAMTSAQDVIRFIAESD